MESRLFLASSWHTQTPEFAPTEPVLLGAESVGEEEEHCDMCQWASIAASPAASLSFYSLFKKIGLPTSSTYQS